MGRYKPNGIPWKGKSAIVPLAAIDDMRKMNHNWNWVALEDIERTCRNLSADEDVFICSECLNETHGFMVDKFGCTVGFGKVVSKCPNCGAKVMRDN